MSAAGVVEGDELPAWHALEVRTAGVAVAVGPSGDEPGEALTAGAAARAVGRGRDGGDRDHIADGLAVVGWIVLSCGWNRADAGPVIVMGLGLVGG